MKIIAFLCVIFVISNATEALDIFNNVYFNIIISYPKMNLEKQYYKQYN